MTIKDIVERLEAVGLPLTYYEFPDGEVPPLPFLVYFITGTHNFFADGTVFEKVNGIAIELYTKEKDFALQEQVESALSDIGGWECVGETFLESENCWEIIYNLEV